PAADDLVDPAVGRRVVTADHDHVAGHLHVAHLAGHDDHPLTGARTDPDRDLLGTGEPALAQDLLDERVRHEAAAERVQAAAAALVQPRTAADHAAPQHGAVVLGGQVLARVDRHVAQAPDPGERVADDPDLQVAL